jgi:hypothetical protein
VRLVLSDDVVHVALIEAFVAHNHAEIVLHYELLHDLIFNALPIAGLLLCINHLFIIIVCSLPELIGYELLD